VITITTVSHDIDPQQVSRTYISHWELIGKTDELLELSCGGHGGNGACDRYHSVDSTNVDTN